jgi:V8-like Glu-specific endopeptidase
LEKEFPMKLTLTLSLLTLSLAASAVPAQMKVVYGEDNRLDVFESNNALFIKLAESTAAMIPIPALNVRGGNVTISGSSLRSRGYCAKERFSNQITAAMCSGFLVGPKLLVTAGHCIESLDDCRANRWVFDYKMENAGTTSITVPQTSVYSCTKIISQKLESGNGLDYALVELDRAVTDREPLKFRKSGQVARGTEIVVIGHPSGLPTKISDGAQVRSSNSKYFVANLDTYGGNSGSAVMDARTGEVQGILVRGENDYIHDPAGNCRATNYCPDTGCRGEDVTHITNVQLLQ